jgi:hypothetical protein
VAAQPPPPNPYEPSGKQGNRTLVLVIVLVLACLCGCLAIPIGAAIPFPVFSQAREVAQRSVCMKNVRDIAKASLIYAVDFDDRFPPAASWMDATSAYLGGSGAAADARTRCPKVKTMGAAFFGYAFNSELSLKETARVTSPETTPLILETPEPGRNVSARGSRMPRPKRHMERDVIGYADGGVGVDPPLP